MTARGCAQRWRKSGPGARSVAEARFRQRVLKSDLPTPTFNAFLRAADGTDIGEVDAWWAEAGVSAEIDSQEYHFYRDGWLRTDAKRSRLLKHGIFPHNIAPSPASITTGTSVNDELRSSLEKWAASARASRSWPSTRERRQRLRRDARRDGQWALVRAPRTGLRRRARRAGAQAGLATGRPAASAASSSCLS